MKIWVAGAGGLLGSALCKMAPDICISSRKEEADVSDLESLQAFANARPEITHIVNCSAFSLVDLAETNRKDAYLVNSLGPENLGKIAKEIGARMVHISTDYVFSGDCKQPLSEEDPVGPVNYYGLTKLEGEQRLLSILPSACLIRTSAIFGEGGKNFVAKLFHLFQSQDEIFLANDQWNSPTFAEDLAIAILKMLDQTGIYHFANQGSATKFTFAEAIYNMAMENGFPIQTKRLIPVPGSFFPSPCKRPAYSVLDTSKIMRLIPTIRTWQEALHTFLQRRSCDPCTLS